MDNKVRGEERERNAVDSSNHMRLLFSIVYTHKHTHKLRLFPSLSIDGKRMTRLHFFSFFRISAVIVSRDLRLPSPTEKHI
jgi:hypothetical protein